MRKLFIVLLFFTPQLLFSQDQYNLTLLSHFDDDNLPIVDGDQVWNDLTGWNDTIKNKEYLIAGSSDSIYFFDITNPSVMIKCDVREGHSRNSINRDYDIYDHYLYCVSDQSSPMGSLQIFDLQYLPDSVHKVYDYDSLAINCHTLFVDAPSKRLYLCGDTHKPAGNWSMGIVDISNPVQPIFLGELDKNLGCSYTHEVFVKRDTAYCSCGYAGLYVIDLRDVNNQKVVMSITPPYVQSGYNHSSWLDSTGKFLMFTDEVPNGLGIKIYDVNDFNDPKFITVFNSHTGATPHNAYWKGRFAYASSYEDGVYVYDLKDIDKYLPSQTPPVAGFYDTYTKNVTGTYHGFHGCWGVWPFLKSGNIIASDISEGLFVLKPSNNLSIAEQQIGLTYMHCSPNPFTTSITIDLHATCSGEIKMELMDVLGNTVLNQTLKVRNGSSSQTIETSFINSGIYFLRVNQNGKVMTQKLIHP